MPPKAVHRGAGSSRSPSGRPKSSSHELEEFAIKGLWIGMLQVVVPCIVPILDYVNVYYKESTLYPYASAYIAANVLVGVVGLAANATRRSPLLATHVALAIIVGCVVGGLSLLVSHLVDVQCRIQSAGFVGCDPNTCPCLLTESCDSDELDAFAGCKACEALPRDVCAYFDFDKETQGFNMETYKAILIVFMNVVSAAHSILLLVRKEHYDGVEMSRRRWIENQILAQTARLRKGEEPDMEGFQLKRLARMCEAHDPAMADDVLKAIAKWEGGGAPMQNGKHGSDALNVEDVDDAG